MARTLSRRSRTADVEPDDTYDDRDAEPARGTRRGERRTAEPEPRSTRRSNRFAEADDDPDDEPADRAAPDDDERSTRRGDRSSRSAHRSDPPDRDAPRSRAGRTERSRRDSEPEPRGRGQRSARTDAPRPDRQGWGGYRQTADSVKSDFANGLKIVDNTDMLIKILEPEPVTSYAEHWLTIEADANGKDGKRRSFICLGTDCPICDRLGDRPSVKVAMNVADMDVDPPEVKVWTFGTQVGDMLEKFAESTKTSPVDRDDLYWTIQRTKKSDRYTTIVRPVKARDLVEDFDTEPLTEEELDELDGQLFTEEQIFTVKSRAELIKMIEDNDLDDRY